MLEGILFAGFLLGYLGVVYFLLWLEQKYAGKSSTTKISCSYKQA